MQIAHLEKIRNELIIILLNILSSLCMDQDLLEAFLSSFTLISQPSVFHDFYMLKIF